MTVKEVHGVAAARRTDDNKPVNVRVVDSSKPDEIFIALYDNYVVAVDAEQANFLAKCLRAAAVRARQRSTSQNK